MLDAGDHVVAGDDLYGGSFRLFDKVFRRLGLTFTYVDARDAGGGRGGDRPAHAPRAGWRRRPTRCCGWPTSAPWRGSAPARGVLLCVDNTFMTPYFQRPLALGADLVVHSTTKYLNGHSDVVGGAVIGRDPELRARLAFLQNSLGGSQPAFDSFLVLRGTKTLAVRMERHQENALAIARWLEARPEVGARRSTRACARTRSTRWRGGRCPGSAACSASSCGGRNALAPRAAVPDRAARRSPAPSRWAASSRWSSTRRS